MTKTADRVVLVVGASSGIGKAIALELARRGTRVFGTTRRDPEQVTATLRDELSADVRIEFLRMDVDEEASVADGIQAVIEATGRLDGLVNCAGFGFGGSVEDATDDEVRAIFETNAFGTLRTCRAVLPILRAQGAGTIVNVSSIGGRIALPFQGLYCATKFAIEGLTESLRMEVRDQGVRVVLVEPGDFATGFTDARCHLEKTKQNPAYSSAFSRAIGVVEKDERGGASPESIGRLVARIFDARSPRLRYTIGPLFQRAAVRLKSVLPPRFFEWGLRQYYRVR